MIVFHFFLVILLTIFSYGFIDPNFPYHGPKLLFDLVYHQRLFATMIYIIIVVGEFGVFWHLLKRVEKKKISFDKIKKIIIATALILFFAFPAFSYDIFNYMATAKVAFLYRENPYLVMPIEFFGEPMLKFMHAANKTALYGPVWILLSAIPHFLGLGNLLLTVFSFKALMTFFYFLALGAIWKISEKNLFSLVFFGLNPLVLIEILVSAHNDIVMMSFCLWGFYFFFDKKKILGTLGIVGSFGIKYATVILFPLFLLPWKLNRERIFTISYWLMFGVFLTAPLREEIYSWYVVWLISFAALVPKKKFIIWLTIALCLGTLLRYAPFLYTESWEGITPLVKKIVTVFPLIVIFFVFSLKRLWSRKILAG